MEFRKEGRFFPNECYVCKTTTKLIRCECNMISYCGKDHQLSHWPIHENFCKALMIFLKENKLSHIYEKLYDVYESDWSKIKTQIRRDLTTKLGRPMSTLENAMFSRPRVCFVCCHVKQDELKNCPGCPVASFCKSHPTNKIHNDNCQPMKNYLNLIKTADELNVDLKFLPSTFPFIQDEVKNDIRDFLTFTVEMGNSHAEIYSSRFAKINFNDFVNIASKIHVALEKIENLPEELTIHIDALRSKDSILKTNYWELILHLNPKIRMLKIVITGSKFNPPMEDLCESCRSLKKILLIEIDKLPYEQYMLKEYYKMPDVIIYCRVEDGTDTKKINTWNYVGCPVIFINNSIEIFEKTKKQIEFLSQFQIVFEGKISTPFNYESSCENFLIFKLRVETPLKTEVVNSDNSYVEEILFLKKKIGCLLDCLNSAIEENEKLKKTIFQLKESFFEKNLREDACCDNGNKLQNGIL